MHLVLLLFALPLAAEDTSVLAAASRLVVVADADDERIATVRAAIAFWEDVFAELQLQCPLGGVTVDSSSPRRSLETYARSLAQQAGRSGSGPGPPAPRELLEQDAAIVLLLSQQKLMPFAWPLQGSGPRFLVALPRDANVEIAKHELGHTLGLRHGASTGLMCMPCAAGSRRELNAAERRELQRLYGAEP
ncbi:MAG: hypothetical protein AAGA81_14415 [Acidobacteriota bacterium]